LGRILPTDLLNGMDVEAEINEADDDLPQSFEKRGFLSFRNFGAVQKRRIGSKIKRERFPRANALGGWCRVVYTGSAGHRYGECLSCV
jgi:hypothetical protein